MWIDTSLRITPKPHMWKTDPKKHRLWELQKSQAEPLQSGLTDRESFWKRWGWLFYPDEIELALWMSRFCLLKKKSQYPTMDLNKVATFLKFLRRRQSGYQTGPKHFSVSWSNTIIIQSQPLMNSSQLWRLVPNRKRSTSRLYIVTLLI